MQINWSQFNKNENNILDCDETNATLKMLAKNKRLEYIFELLLLYTFLYFKMFPNLGFKFSNIMMKSYMQCFSLYENHSIIIKWV